MREKAEVEEVMEGARGLLGFGLGMGLAGVMMEEGMDGANDGGANALPLSPLSNPPPKRARRGSGGQGKKPAGGGTCGGEEGTQQLSFGMGGR